MSLISKVGIMGILLGLFIPLFKSSTFNIIQMIGFSMLTITLSFLLLKMEERCLKN